MDKIFGGKLKKVLLLIAVVAMSFVVVGIVQAQITTGLDALSEASGLPTGNIFITIANIIRIILGLLGIILVGLIVYAGFLWMTAAGDPKKVETAQKIIRNAIIGIIIIALAFGIAQFILSSLVSATREGSGGPGGPGGGIGGRGFGETNFILRGITPYGAVPIRNVVARATFNAEVNGATVAGNFTVTRASDGNAVDGTLTTARNTIEFVPSANCPAPNEDRKCFDADTAYNIRMTTNLKDTSGRSLVCGGFAPSCDGNFITGNLVDVAGPAVNVTAPDNGESISADSIIALQAGASDDTGIAQIEFFVDDAFVGVDAPIGATPVDFSASLEWNTVGIAVGRHNISARAYDIDSNITNSSAIMVNVQPAHCFNGARDADEEGLDCGGDGCSACDGAACEENTDCASGLCRGGICVSTPSIEDVSLSNGKVGNYITISGRFFGNEVGRVIFQGTANSDDDREANLAPCSGTWQNDEVVIVVPDEAVDGPIQLCAANNECDTTNNDRGFIIADFDVNDTARPGICGLNPRAGLSGDAITISGSQFGESQGGSSASLGGRDISPTDWGNVEIRGTVPNISAGRYSVQVAVGGEQSNIVNFTATSREAGTVPSILSITPASGPREQYVQISGANFGNEVGVVVFRNSASGDEANGLTNFPAQCSNAYWNDNSITAKVPQQYLNETEVVSGAYFVRVRRVDGVESGTADFSIVDGAAGPGICRINPNNGPESTNVEVYGERFGTLRGQLRFTLNKDASVSRWDDRVILSFVPNGAETGAVNAIMGEQTSNTVNFTVQDCNQSGCTGDGMQCCRTGVCVPEGEECTGGPRAGGFAWRFSTGIIPTVPRVIEECREGASPSPSPWDKRRGGNNVCINAAVNVRFTTNINPLTLNDRSILVYQCTGAGENPCNNLTRIEGMMNVYENGFQFVPNGGNFVPSSQYYVYLTTGIQGEGEFGEYMVEDVEKCGEGNSYCFGFATRAGVDLCAVGSAVVDPASYVIREKNGTADYVASAISQNDICIALNSNAYDWNWTATKENGSPQLNVTITNEDGIGGGADGTEPDGNTDARQIATGLVETIPDPAIHINAEIPSERVSDFGQLVIDFTDPEIVSKWPSCNTACVNSEIGAKFNTLMDEGTLTREGNFTVLRCTNENCRRYDETLAGSITYDTETSIAVFNHRGLEQNTYYRAIIHGGQDGVKSSSGVKLIKTNYGAEDFTWIFKTRNSDEPCAISSVDLEPDQAILSYIGELQNYNVSAMGAPDECNPNGQRLIATDYNWNWGTSVPTVADFFMSAGTLIDVLPRSENISGCSNMCLRTGTLSGIPVCGNGGALERGEDCDDGNILSGDGCDARCLNEGSVLACGNNIKDAREDCDDGNTATGDGCDASCLNEGSEIGGSVCGNGDIGDGEDCDDGNRQNGDGCSSLCLNEGSITGPLALCGNGRVENGEDCDDGNLTVGDGCSAICLNEGKNACYTADLRNCCGNGGAPERGEDCDDGNTLNGDGCSSRCLSEGSSINYDSICGNGASVIDLEQGEECEFPNPPSGDRKSDPGQIAIAQGGGITNISASTSGVEGAGSLEVMCVCRRDLDCQSGSAQITRVGCGNTGCCISRPVVESIIPASSSASICRNSVVTVNFSQEMDAESLRQNFQLVELAIDGSCPEGTEFRVPRYCARKGALNIVDKDGKTSLNFISESPFSPNKLYTISIWGDSNLTDDRLIGVKNKNGVVMYRNYSSRFTTGTEICTISQVEMDPPSPISFLELRGKTVTARAIAIVGGSRQEIFSAPGVYSWSWDWVNGDTSLLQLSDTALQNQKTLTPLLKKGKTRIEAGATILEDRVLTPSTVDKEYVAKADVIVMICVNPWPARRYNNSWSPYIDYDTNFMIYYCRDAGEEEMVDDLPALPNKPKSVPAPPISRIIQEYILPVLCPPESTTCKSGDAFGIRVAKNAEHYSPMKWYGTQGFRGSPVAVIVDGFEAAQDGRTVYINAFNNPLDSFGRRTALYFTNIYILSHTQNAGTDTQEIFNQIYENIGFAANIRDLDLKDRITRDVKRLSDIRTMEENFKGYASTHKKCSTTLGTSCNQDSDCPNSERCVSVYPSLESGSYTPRFTNSKWPSWQGGLTSELGKSLPSDPINKLGECDVAGFDSGTCYNSISRNFIWPQDSYVYVYENCLMKSYSLRFNLEFSEADWSMNNLYPEFIYGLKNRFDIRTDTELSSFCNLEISTPDTSDVPSSCGNGIREGAEVCDDGTLNGVYNHCRIDCNGLGLYCGDGYTQTPPIGVEVCDEGSLNGQYDHCSWDCRSLKSAYCGDNVINGTEECDGGLESSKTVAGLSACGLVGGYETQRTRMCSDSCIWGGWSSCQTAGSCGNGIKDGTDEQCDDGNSSNNDSCINVCRTAYCGDGFVRANYEQCDMGGLNGVRCSAGSGLTCSFCSNFCTLLTISGE